MVKRGLFKTVHCVNLTKAKLNIKSAHKGDKFYSTQIWSLRNRSIKFYRIYIYTNNVAKVHFLDKIGARLHQQQTL